MITLSVPPPRISSLRVRNYRALRDVEFRDLSPLTVLIGANGSGKSTVFDIFAFLSECFTDGLRRAWDRRNRFREMRSRGSDGPIVIELKYRETAKTPLITYRLEIDEQESGPVIVRELLRWKRGSYGRPFTFLEFENGRGRAAAGDFPDEEAERIEETLASAEVLAVNTLGQFERHPRVRALREFITGWHLSYLSAQDPRGTPEAGPQEHLSRNGANLANVIQYLRERYPDHLDRLIEVLCRRVPRLEKVNSEILADGRLLLQFKDAPFDRPILAKYASDGTIKLLAYLILIHDPDPLPLIGIEEPENFLYPILQRELAEECAVASRSSQLMVTTHSPFFINALNPKQVYVLKRAENGFTQAVRAIDMPGVEDFMAESAVLGDLWMEGHLESAR